MDAVNECNADAPFGAFHIDRRTRLFVTVPTATAAAGAADDRPGNALGAETAADCRATDFAGPADR